MKTLREASFSELMSAASKKLSRDQCLILAVLDDDPSHREAYVILGDRECTFVPRDSIVAHGR